MQTSRLVFRPFAKSDLKTIHKIFADEFVRKFLFDDEIISLEQASDFIETSEKLFAEKGFGLWLLSLKESGETVGFVGLWHFFEENQPQLLYGLLPEFAGKGLASEAAEKIVEYSFTELGFEYLTASCDAPNTASHKVAERLGMKKFKEEMIDDKPIVFFKVCKQ